VVHARSALCCTLLWKWEIARLSPLASRLSPLASRLSPLTSSFLACFSSLLPGHRLRWTSSSFGPGLGRALAVVPPEVRPLHRQVQRVAAALRVVHPLRAKPVQEPHQLTPRPWRRDAHRLDSKSLISGGKLERGRKIIRR
jgi:hypothetical protein